MKHGIHFVLLHVDKRRRHGVRITGGERVFLACNTWTATRVGSVARCAPSPWWRFTCCRRGYFDTVSVLVHLGVSLWRVLGQINLTRFVSSGGSCIFSVLAYLKSV